MGREGWNHTRALTASLLPDVNRFQSTKKAAIAAFFLGDCAAESMRRHSVPELGQRN